jgi:hypothetical protein
MDLISIAGTFWRHKLFTIPVILLTLLGALYILKIKPPVYEADSSFLLSVPPGPPTAAQIATDPGLGKINSNNPYTSYGNMSVAASVLADLMTTPAAAQQLVDEGVDPRYQIAPNTEFGFTAPVIQITGIGSTPEGAIRSANLVYAKALSDLYEMQKEQGVNRFYMIKAIPLVLAEKAQLSASSKLRELIAILGGGAVLLFVTISVADAIERRKRKPAMVNASAAGRTNVDEMPLEHRRPLAEGASRMRPPVASRSGQRRHDSSDWKNVGFYRRET